MKYQPQIRKLPISALQLCITFFCPLIDPDLHDIPEKICVKVSRNLRVDIHDMHITFSLIPYHRLIVQPRIRVRLNVDIQHAINLQLKSAKQTSVFTRNSCHPIRLSPGKEELTESHLQVRPYFSPHLRPQVPVPRHRTMCDARSQSRPPISRLLSPNRTLLSRCGISQCRVSGSQRHGLHRCSLKR